MKPAKSDYDLIVCLFLMKKMFIWKNTTIKNGTSSKKHSFGLSLHRLTIEISKLANRFSSWRKNTLSGNKRLAVFSITVSRFIPDVK